MRLPARVVKKPADKHETEEVGERSDQDGASFATFTLPGSLFAN